MKAEHIAANLKNLRKKHNLTQENLAESLAVSRQTINALETGKYLPSILLAVEIADFFNLAFEEIFCESLNSKRREENMPKDLSPWSPFREIDSLHDAIDKTFDETFFSSQSALALPKINVACKDKNVVIEAEIPGVDEKNLDIEVGENAVRISGEKKDEKEINEKDYFHKEVSYGSFQRVVALPCEVKHDKADAEVRDGVLKIVIPKAEIKKAKTVKLKAKKISKKK